MIGKNWRIWLAVAAVVCFLLVGRNFLGQLPRLVNANGGLVAAASGIYLLTLWLQSETLRWGLKAVGQPFAQRESFGLTLVSSYANLLVPKSGMGAMAAYFGKTRKAEMTQLGAVLFANSLLFIFATSVIGLLVFGSAIGTSDWASVVLFTVCGVASVASFICVRIDWQFANRYKGLGANQIKKLINAQRLVCKPSVVFQIGLINLCLVLLRAVRLQIVFWAIGEAPSFYAVLMMSVLGDLSFLIAFTPAALGFRESALAYGAAKLGLAIPVALSAAVLDRLVFSLTTVVASQVAIGFGLLGDWTKSRKPKKNEVAT